MGEGILKLSLIVLISLFIINCGGGKVDEHFKSLPESIGDWKAGEKDEIYDRKTLYDYMNGGAELYLAFDFRQVFVRRYSGPNENGIVLDIYDMGSSAEAFGIFSSDREDEDIGIGQGSEYGAGLLRFWKDRYFVSVIAQGDEETAGPVMIEIAKSVAGLIEQTGEEPGLTKVLPEKGLIKNRTSFFHSDVNLNNRFFVASENILNLHRETDCVFAEYGFNSGETVYLLIVKYGTPELAGEAVRSFVNTYMPEAGETKYIKTENGKWTAAETRNNYVIIVFDAQQKEQALKLISNVTIEE